MAWTAPRTWVTGELVTAAIMNAQIRDNELLLYNVIADFTAVGALASFDTNTILGGNIPPTYSHLAFKLYGRGDSATTNVAVWARINNDSGGNYDYELHQVAAAAVTASENFAQAQIAIGQMAASTATANVFSQLYGELEQYTGTVGHKQVTTRWGLKRGVASGDIFTGSVDAWWRSTAAVTRLTVLPASGNFIAGSRFTLYGAI